MTRQKQRYTLSFKKEVLAYWQSSEESAAEVAGHFGVSENSLYKWRKQLGERPLGGGAETVEEELRRLRRENRRLKMQTEILKKTLGIISSADENAWSALRR